MKIEKLPSGSYRARKRIDGKDVSIVLPYKPTQKEALQLLIEKASGKDKLKLTFAEAGEEYIQGKAATISPSTAVGYRCIINNLPSWFTESALGDITSWDVQRVVNEQADGLSAKTVRNRYSFICAVFSVFRPQLVISATLPQKQQEQPYLPSDDDIRAIINHVSGTEYEIPLRLACYGLRRSEICAVTSDDLSGNNLTISKAKVTSNQGWVIKQPKTTDSARTILIDAELADMIRSAGVAFRHNPDRIYKALKRVQKELGLPSFPLHAFRHYYASTLHSMGVSNAAIQQNGGWRTDYTMKRHYIQAVQDEADEAQRAFMDRMTTYDDGSNDNQE